MKRIPEVLIISTIMEGEYSYAALTSIVEDGKGMVCYGSTPEIAKQRAAYFLQEEGYNIAIIDEAECKEQISNFMKKYGYK